jgi:hypothetical protein
MVILAIIALYRNGNHEIKIIENVSKTLCYGMKKFEENKDK